MNEHGSLAAIGLSDSIIDGMHEDIIIVSSYVRIMSCVAV